jgi:hypothetical protein
MKLPIYLALLAIGAAACAEFPDKAFKSKPVELGAGDTVTGFEAAKDAVGLLRDGTFQQPGPFEDVEVTPSSVTVKTFKQGKSESEGYYYRGYSTGSSVFTESRAQVSIWLADIKSISVEHQIVYDQGSDHGYTVYSRGNEAYLCKLTLKDDRTVPFAATRESYAKRVAAGFGFLAKVPVSAESGYPAAGCTIDAKANIVSAELIDGPFDKAGIPLGCTVKAVDGHAGSDVEIRSRLYALTVGTHIIDYRQPGEFVSVSKQVFIENVVPDYK